MPPDPAEGLAGPEIDWTAIQYHYEAATLSIHEIALRYGTKDTTLRDRAKRLGWQRGDRTGLAHTTPLADRKQRVQGRHQRDIAALLALLDKLRSGLERIVDGAAEARDDRLLTKTGGAIEAFNVLANSQAKLVQLHRQAFGLDLPTIEDPRQFAEELRAAQREMEAMSRGIPKPPDLSLDGPLEPSGAGGL